MVDSWGSASETLFSSSSFLFSAQNRPGEIQGYPCLGIFSALLFLSLSFLSLLTNYF